MKKAIIIGFALLLSGCCTIPDRNFPDVPPELLVECPNLNQTPPTENLSSVVGVVVDNYGLYYNCQDRNGKWIKWYVEQRKIFNSVEK